MPSKFPNRMQSATGEVIPVPEPRPDVTVNDSLNPDQASNDAEFKRLQAIVSKLANTWDAEKNETQTRRDLRYMPLDVARERAQGNIKIDEIIIPIRVINDNITKEQAQFIAYLTTSRNSAIFKLKTKFPSGNMPDLQPLEEWFTGLVRFPSWEIPYFQVLDGAETHGTDFVEVGYDKDTPGHFNLDQLAHENVWYPQDCENLQKANILVRNCRVTKEELLQWKEVDKGQVDILFQESSNLNEIKSLEDIQKVFYRKEDGIVYVCWMHHKKSTAFIRAPKPLHLGRVQAQQDALRQISFTDLYETLYPIECLPYIVSENKRLKDVKGRAFFDEYIQEAVTSLVSSIINAWHRASQVYASMENPSSGGSPEQLITILAGKIYSQKINFFHMDYPDAEGMSIVNGLLTQNKAETGQINFAVGNRNDYASRKTAKEISSAEQQTALLGAVQVTLFSIFIRNVMTRKWSIAQSQALQGLIEVPEKVKPLLNYEYELYSAGDTEVVKRAETKQSLMQAWPVVANTPAAMPMLEDLLTLLFPQNAEKYVTALRQGDPKQLVASLASILGSIIQEHPDIVPSEQLPKIEALFNAANQVSGASVTEETNNGPSPTQPSQSNQQPVQTSTASS